MEGRSRREQVQLQAAEMFGQDADARQVAKTLRVSTKSVYQWRRAWRAGGEAALASKGAGGNPCKLDEAQVTQLQAADQAISLLPGRGADAVEAAGDHQPPRPAVLIRRELPALAGAGVPGQHRPGTA